MLMTPITPKVMASPMAASSSTEPSDSPYQAFCSASQNTSRLWMPVIASCASFCTAGGVFAGRPDKQRDRFLVAAIANDGDGVELLNFGGVVLVEKDGGTRACAARA